MGINDCLKPFKTAWEFVILWVRFALYFAVIILGIGGLGVWISYAQYRFQVTGVSAGNVLMNLATFIIAIAVTAFADYLVTKNENDERTKSLLLFSFTLISSVAAVCIFVITIQKVQVICALVGFLLTTVTWLCVNSRNRDLVDEKPVNVLGGNV
jgi:hypothetical protein